MTPFGDMAMIFLLFMILAVICFALAAFKRTSLKVDFGWLGMLFLAVALYISAGHPVLALR
jgi:succinate-acetate transporter protein